MRLSFPRSGRFVTQGGIEVSREVGRVEDINAAIDVLATRLDQERGLIQACDVTQPGRYRPRVLGFAAPPVAISARDRTFRVKALNARGGVLLPIFAQALERTPFVTLTQSGPAIIEGLAEDSGEPTDESLRTQRGSIFTVVRALRDAIATDDDHHLGLYGVFGYDLALQIDPIRRRLARPHDQRDLVLYLPDEIMFGDPETGQGYRVGYDFTVGSARTHSLPRASSPSPIRRGNGNGCDDDHPPGAYPAVVREALEEFRRGNLFEAVPSQTFLRPSTQTPSILFSRLRKANPAPFGLLANLGEDEALVSASPEMFVRSDAQRIETAPISGTVPRGRDALGDADAIFQLLASDKEAAELTMCTDVDRNDKARVCRPGSVRILGRRQIEMYSRLIHTVDHVEGTLRPDLDALDGFLAHAWAVTVTGAPKKGAMQFIENHEKQPRRWYGGAFGAILADGGLDTGLTLRTIRLSGGMAEVRAGATLLIDSDPEAEDRECRLKASALLAILDGESPAAATPRPAVASIRSGRKVLVVDHEDSFVHTLADYLRQLGAETRVVRQAAAALALRDFAPDLVVLSPGPGRPEDFHLSDTIGRALDHGAAIFGVCLGLQGIAEYFGGSLDIGPAMHGKPARIHVRGGRILDGLPRTFQAGRYHSLHARRDTLPHCLEIAADLEDGTIMALEHRTLPVAGVQFHPESLLTLADQTGLTLLSHVLECLIPQSRIEAA